MTEISKKKEVIEKLKFILHKMNLPIHPNPDEFLLTLEIEQLKQSLNMFENFDIKKNYEMYM